MSCDRDCQQGHNCDCKCSSDKEAVIALAVIVFSSIMTFLVGWGVYNLIGSFK